MKEMKIFALNATKAFGEQVAANLKMKLSEHEEYSFEDGECYCASLENVRGKDVFVVQSVYDDNEESVHSKLMKTFIFLGALRDASVKRVTVVLPYIGGRQDRKTASRAPITTKYIARLFKAMWVDRILALDVHNPTAIQNAYAIPTDLLEAKNLFATKVAEMMRAREEREVVIVSPDSGGL
jgi:ribose-phosphate pyrophosphokinase